MNFLPSSPPLLSPPLRAILLMAAEIAGFRKGWQAFAVPP
jgi:hypothetical protein